MIFDILEAKIVAAGLAVPGESLGRSFLAADITVGVMTRIPLEGIAVDPDVPDYYRGRIQVVTRHTDPVAGIALANRVAKVLTVRSPENYPASAERGPARISLFIPQTLPILYPRLDGGGLEWSQHFSAAFSFDPLVE